MPRVVVIFEVEYPKGSIGMNDLTDMLETLQKGYRQSRMKEAPIVLDDTDDVVIRGRKY